MSVGSKYAITERYREWYRKQCFSWGFYNVGEIVVIHNISPSGRVELTRGYLPNGEIDGYFSININELHLLDKVQS